MKSIRCGSGLGDSLYLQAAVRHLVNRGEPMEVCSDWPDVFRPLGDKVRVVPFRRPVDINCHYAPRKHVPHTTQFQDICIRAGARGTADLKLDWTPRNNALVEQVRALSPVLVVPMARQPFNRKDRFGIELLPNCGRIQQGIDRARSHGFKVVQVGQGDKLWDFGGIDLDLAHRTSVSDLIDVAYAADGFLGYVSFAVPLAESLDKPALFVWSRRGAESASEFVRQITPKKILHKPSSRAVFDDCHEVELHRAVDALCGDLGTAASLSGQDGRDRRQRAGGAG